MQNLFSFICKSLVLLTALVLSVSVSANSQTSVSITTTQTSVSINVDKKGFSINQTSLKFPISVQDIEKVLGKSNRTFAGVQRVSTWDDLGLVGYQQSDIDGFTEIGVIFNIAENKFDFMPKRTFQGQLTVDGAKISNKSTRTSINKTKTGAKFVSLPLMSALTEAQTGEQYMVMWQASERGAVPLGTVLQISISKAK